ncbi:uncharacterized protein LOC9653278 [Selaginella moellendorffii]|uniref:uncharacterized protein LOC9653278 n=1 Tax=Selaginella moellendorffii TaxID=88036 RepID=UPI000D1CAE1F|nr:uncharacterized protein LOC9653278 [Selaginella moellendorffii]|eukprot:XP_024538945.1 uncharacterized protein LOC9653278 [Selaginella moellendorffii]
MVFRKRSESPTVAMLGEALPPLLEFPDKFAAKNSNGVKGWVKEQLENHLQHLGLRGSGGIAQCSKRFRARQLLATLGISLGPFPVGKIPPTVSPKDSPIETSSAQYIVQQYIAATGGAKLHTSIHNSYASGRLKMVLTEFESTAGGAQMPTTTTTTTSGIATAASTTASSIIRPGRELCESGSFVLWQMFPDRWYVELSVGGTKVRAGCDAKTVWKQSPMAGSQSVRGPIRPLRRALHGLDHKTLASMFLNARCVGEKRTDGEDCFVLKLAADSYALTAGYRAVPPADASAARHGAGADPADPEVEEEVIRHVAFGYFSQRSGLLVRMEDSQLTRIQAARGAVSYWEVTVETRLGEYRAVEEGAPVVPHAGSTVVSVFRFGEESMCHTRSRVEESWWIDEAAYNVAGLSAECFIPPCDATPAPMASDAGEMFAQHDGFKDQNLGSSHSLW